eukprot:TRINITY_DN9411_c0_g1_i3.p1 TRINITY_DN9411_c0_g1~~TRINITY_DN9411_c0_g1_i3.p1  ORF type:complete len:438 (-),score=82.86 TRINITY_DN9411_c0_g1_i3:73-1386(-)
MIRDYNVTMTTTVKGLLEKLVFQDPVEISDEQLSEVLQILVEKEIHKFGQEFLNFKEIQKWRAVLEQTIQETTERFDFSLHATVADMIQRRYSEVLSGYVTADGLKSLWEERVGPSREKSYATGQGIFALNLTFRNTLTDSSNLEDMLIEKLKEDTKMQDQMSSHREKISAIIYDLEVIFNKEPRNFQHLLDTVVREEFSSLHTEMEKALYGDVYMRTQSELSKLSCDEVGMKDYALYNNGGEVVSTTSRIPLTLQNFNLLYDEYTSFDPAVLTPLERIQYTIWKLRKMMRSGGTLINPTSKLAISVSNHPGDCWSFPGNEGNLTIKLSQPVFVTHVTLEHLKTSLAGKFANSAPREFKVYGLMTGKTPPVLLLSETFTFDPTDTTVGATCLKTFQVTPQHSPRKFKHVMLSILSNYGANQTSLYRFRVHSELSVKK